jgi:hypothetical protein
MERLERLRLIFFLFLLLFIIFGAAAPDHYICRTSWSSVMLVISFQDEPCETYFAKDPYMAANKGAARWTAAASCYSSLPLRPHSDSSAF